MTKQTAYKIAIVAAFNEAATIEEVVRKILRHVDEVIVINDCSSDATAERAASAGALVLHQGVNRGYDCALQKGFECALRRQADIILTIDGDGQHNPDDIPRLIAPLVAGTVDLVISQRPKLNHFCERIFSLYSRLRYGIRDPLCGLKAYSRPVCEKVGHFDTLGSIGTQLMFEAVTHGFRIELVPIQIRERLDTSRFYIKRFWGNLRILRALIRVVVGVSKNKIK